MTTVTENISFWNNNHPRQDEYEKLYDALVPASGEAETLILDEGLHYAYTYENDEMAVYDNMVEAVLDYCKENPLTNCKQF